MNSRVFGLRVAAVVFAIVCLAHVLRLATHSAILIAGNPIPSWPSVVGAIVTGALAIWMWRLASGPAS